MLPSCYFYYGTAALLLSVPRAALAHAFLFSHTIGLQWIFVIFSVLAFGISLVFLYIPGIPCSVAADRNIHSIIRLVVFTSLISIPLNIYLIFLDYSSDKVIIESLLSIEVNFGMLIIFMYLLGVQAYLHPKLVKKT